MEVFVKHRLLAHLLVLTLILLGTGFNIQPAQAEEPVVRAVLFFSPTCPHCHEIINNVLPPLSEKYGEQLKIAGVDISHELGQVLYQAAVEKFNIPNNRLGVPTMIVGELVLVGSGEIEAVFPDLVERYLDSEGMDWPDIPGLREALALQAEAPEPTTTESENPGTANPGTENSIGEESQTTSERPAFIQKFTQDTLANSISVIVLLGMIASVIGVGYSFVKGTDNRLLQWPKWVLPVLCIAGMGVALYLSYIEFSRTEAICGPVGDCNRVQESVYAYLFGVIPIGAMGVAGYIAILAAWLVQEYGPTSWNKYAAQSIWGMAWFGVLFSIYLTFLEPFVIGATCAWCITSAIVMTLILLASTEPALQTLSSDDAEFEDESEEEDDLETGEAPIS